MFRGNTIGAVTAAIMSLAAFFPASAAENTGIDETCVAAVCTSLRTKAEHGDVEAALALGGLYLNGNGVPIDNAAAFKWIILAAQHGNAKAQATIGWMYLTGRGVSKSGSTAAKWYRQAAEQGFTPAQTSYGWLLHVGDGIPIDDKEALHWLLLAAHKNDFNAQGFLGLIYYKDGEGTPEEDKEALKWLLPSAEHGFPPAQTVLGAIYHFGLGTPKNDVLAEMWAIIASRDPIPVDALKELQKEIEGSMSPKDLLEAKHRAEIWQPKTN